MKLVAEGTVDRDSLLEYTTTIVASHVSNNPVAASELTDLIDTVFDKLSALSTYRNGQNCDAIPAVPIEESVQQDYIVCLEDGKHFKMLKKHLMAHYSLTPAEYRAKWGLPRDYPMVSPNYAAKRQKLALASGLGKNRQ